MRCCIKFALSIVVVALVIPVLLSLRDQQGEETTEITCSSSSAITNTFSFNRKGSNLEYNFYTAALLRHHCFIQFDENGDRNRFTKTQAIPALAARDSVHLGYDASLLLDENGDRNRSIEKQAIPNYQTLRLRGFDKIDSIKEEEVQQACPENVSIPDEDPRWLQSSPFSCSSLSAINKTFRSNLEYNFYTALLRHQCFIELNENGDRNRFTETQAIPNQALGRGFVEQACPGTDIPALSARDSVLLDYDASLRLDENGDRNRSIEKQAIPNDQILRDSDKIDSIKEEEVQQACPENVSIPDKIDSVLLGYDTSFLLNENGDWNHSVEKQAILNLSRAINSVLLKVEKMLIQIHEANIFLSLIEEALASEQNPRTGDMDDNITSSILHLFNLRRMNETETVSLVDNNISSDKVSKPKPKPKPKFVKSKPKFVKPKPNLNSIGCLVCLVIAFLFVPF